MFKSARIKLTAYYLLITMFITLSFSTIVYSSMLKQTKRALGMGERRMRNRIYNNPNFSVPLPESFLNEETISEIKRGTLFTLTIVNIFILIGAGLPGYWLAGKTLKPIEEMLEKQKKFTADAAHELKTPLAAMKTDLEVNLRDKKINLDRAKDIMRDTIKDVDSLTLLTNSLIKQSKYQIQELNDKEIFELKKLIEKVVKKLESKSKQKGINVNVEGEEIEIKASKESISELLTIFVDNAIKFSNEKGLIEIKTEENREYVLIKVKDMGLGIDEKDLPYIFNRFYKSDSSRSKNERDGFGLGLSIAKEIAEAHNGKITVKTEVGRGTEFTIKLPHSK